MAASVHRLSHHAERLLTGHVRVSEQKRSSETPVLLSALRLPSQAQASELTAGHPHARGPQSRGQD